MSNKFEVKHMERGEIETIGEVIKNRMFLPLIILTAISNSQLLVMSVGEYWPAICLKLDAALFGLIGGVYTMAIGTSTLVISWLLVDDCSWFFKCTMLFCSSVLFIVCGIYYFYAFFESYECAGSEFTQDSQPNNNLSLFSNLTNSNLTYYMNNLTLVPEFYNTTYIELSEFLYICYSGASLEDASAWTPILIVICIFLGVLYFLFAVYLFISLDEG